MSKGQDSKKDVKKKPLLTAKEKKAAKKAANAPVMSDDERRKLVSTEQSLGMESEPKIPTAIEGLETFTLSGSSKDEDDDVPHGDFSDAESFFNLPDGAHDDDDDEDDDKSKRSRR